MAAVLKFEDAAKRALNQFRKKDPQGIDQVFDAINSLTSNPNQGKQWGEYRRMHVGMYRVMYRVVGKNPIIVKIEHIGR